jgi:hypothetical protein
MRLRPMVVLVAAAVLLTACGDDPGDPVTPPSTPAGSTAVAGPSSAAATPGIEPGIEPGTEPGGTGKPEIATNPDGTINSGGPRPGTSESVLTAGGFGPYKIGVSQKDLDSGDLIGTVTAVNTGNCPGYGTAEGIGRYHSPALVFFKGRLLRVTVATDEVATDKGVKVGTTMGDVQGKYPAGKQIDDWTGRGAWLATVGDYGLLFDMRDNKVAAMQAGMTEPMQFKYTDNQGC